MKKFFLVTAIIAVISVIAGAVAYLMLNNTDCDCEDCDC